MPDAFDVGVVQVGPESVRQRRENGHLVRRVAAVHVERRIGFGVTEFLRFGENFVEIPAFGGHARQDVIAGAVDDAVDEREPVGDETFADRLDDRDAAANAGLVEDIGRMLLRRRKNLFAVMGQQRFVGGDDDLAATERVEDDLLRETGAADEFDNDVNIGIAKHLLRVGGEDVCRQTEFLQAGFVLVANPFQVQAHTEPLGNEVGVAGQIIDHAAADDSGTDQTDVQL